MKNILKHTNKVFLIILICLLFTAAYGQKKITGTVLSATGEALENAKVIVKENSSLSVFTDKTGKFEIDTEDNEHLVVEYKNVKKKTIAVSDLTDDKAIVIDCSSILVHVGYGQEIRAEEIASSVGIIGRDKIGKITSPDVGNALFGQIQGLRVFQNAGHLPEERMPTLSIRGRATTQDASILILIDGAERPLDGVLPEEIESITILRDAAAKARYGQHGGNGVMLITTKRGSKGDTRFTATVEQGITEPTRLPSFLDAAGYAKAENEARINDGLPPLYSDAAIGYFQSGEYPYLFPNVNWLDEILANNGYFSRYNFNFTGGNDITNYFVSLNYQNEEGLYKNTNTNDDYSTQIRYDKFNIKTNLDIRLTPTTTARVNMGGYIGISKQPATPGARSSGDSYVMGNTTYYDYVRGSNRDIVLDAFAVPAAAFPVKNEDGTWGGTNQRGNNPVAEICDMGYDRNHIRSLYNELSLKQDLNSIVEGLTAEVFGSYYNRADFWENKTKTFEYKEVIPILDATGSITNIESRMLGQETDLTPVRYSGDLQRTSYSLRGTLDYSRIFGEHAVNAWAVAEQEQYDYHVINGVYRYCNFAANAHYVYAGKYFIDGTLSYSGTNRIQDHKDRYGFFPAIAGAWMLSRESFMQRVDIVDMLKLRASFGLVGNGLIGISEMTSNKYGGGYSFYLGDTYTGQSTTRETSLGIAHKKFETSVESNLGIEATLFDKLDLNAELFFVDRKNIFVPAAGQYSTILGLIPQAVPEGEVKNRGYELQATWSDQVGDFGYYFTAMFSKYQNKIIDQNEEYRPYDYMKRTGHSIGQYFGWESAGFFQTEADIASRPKQLFGDVKPGDVIYNDKNDDDYVDDYDQTAIGYAWEPEVYYSFSLGFAWKGFEVSAQFQGLANASTYLSTAHIFWPLVGDDNISTWYKNYWSPDNPNNAKAELPRLSKSSDNNYRTNDIWVRDRSFLKLRYAEIAYSLPQSLLGHIKLQNVKVYLRGRDLASFDKIKYIDPENQGTYYPSLRNYNIGVSIKF